MSIDFRGPPGAVAVSHLAVYDSTSPDGVRGGSAHVHLTCTESYRLGRLFCHAFRRLFFFAAAPFRTAAFVRSVLAHSSNLLPSG
jgi:hypothetical protein